MYVVNPTLPAAVHNLHELGCCGICRQHHDFLRAVQRTTHRRQHASTHARNMCTSADHPTQQPVAEANSSGNFASAHASSFLALLFLSPSTQPREGNPALLCPALPCLLTFVALCGGHGYRWMSGTSTNSGMLQMLAAVRKHTKAPVVIAGRCPPT